MAYTFTVTNNIQALDFVEVVQATAKKIKKEKETTAATYSQEVLQASEVLQISPQEIVEAAEYYQMSADDYAFTMMLSKKNNKKVSNRLRERFNL